MPSSLKVVLSYQSFFYYTETVIKGQGKTSEFFGLIMFQFGAVVKNESKRCDDLYLVSAFLSINNYFAELLKKAWSVPASGGSH